MLAESRLGRGCVLGVEDCKWAVGEKKLAEAARRKRIASVVRVVVVDPLNVCLTS